MKLNIQRSQLYIYMPFINTDGIKIISVFEDMDETCLNFNVNCSKKPLKFLSDSTLGLETKSTFSTKNVIKKNFYNDFFK